MKARYYLILTALSASALFVGRAQAQSSSYRQGNQPTKYARPYPILEQPIDSRNLGMGGGGFGEATVAPLHSNPTSILYGDKSYQASVQGAYRSMPEGIEGKISNFSGMLAGRFGKFGVLLGGRSRSVGSFVPIDKDLADLPAQSLSAYSIDGTVVAKFGNFSIAQGVSYLSSNEGVKTSHILLNTSVYLRSNLSLGSKDARLTLGAKASNIGVSSSGEGVQTTITAEARPASSYGLGGELSLDLSTAHMLNFTASAQLFSHEKEQYTSQLFTAGAEYQWNKTLALRAGYRADTNGLKGFTLGAGARFAGIGLDVAYVSAPSEYAKPMMQAGLSFHF